MDFIHILYKIYTDKYIHLYIYLMYKPHLYSEKYKYSKYV